MRKHVMKNDITHNPTRRMRRAPSMALTSRCRLRGRKISVETECGRIMSSRSDRYTMLSVFIHRVWSVCFSFNLQQRPDHVTITTLTPLLHETAEISFFSCKEYCVSMMRPECDRIVNAAELNALETRSSSEVGELNVDTVVRHRLRNDNQRNYRYI